MITKGLRALTTSKERQEMKPVLLSTTAIKLQNASLRSQLRLKRTFDMNLGSLGVVKFWRVVGPASHPHIDSDMSVEGMLSWGVIAPKGII